MGYCRAGATWATGPSGKINSYGTNTRGGSKVCQRKLLSKAGSGAEQWGHEDSQLDGTVENYTSEWNQTCSQVSLSALQLVSKHLIHLMCSSSTTIFLNLLTRQDRKVILFFPIARYQNILDPLPKPSTHSSQLHADITENYPVHHRLNDPCHCSYSLYGQ